eukprot:scaffold168033_cov17-Tisochrysis_lutea.AAC.1
MANKKFGAISAALSLTARQVLSPTALSYQHHMSSWSSSYCCCHHAISSTHCCKQSQISSSNA